MDRNIVAAAQAAIVCAATCALVSRCAKSGLHTRLVANHGHDQRTAHYGSILLGTLATLLVSLLAAAIVLRVGLA